MLISIAKVKIVSISEAFYKYLNLKTLRKVILRMLAYAICQM
jgi:hypothetical protein